MNDVNDRSAPNVEQTTAQYDDLVEALDSVASDDVETKIAFAAVSVTSTAGDTVDAAERLTTDLRDAGVDVDDFVLEQRDGSVEFFAAITSGDRE